MAIIKTYRALKNDQPEPDRIRKLFAKKKDEQLLAALANPEHSEAAREILRTLAEERELQSEEERGRRYSGTGSRPRGRPPLPRSQALGKS